jgi:nucleoside diphosphate kinase
LPSNDRPKKNTAFVFAKPHANTPAVLEVIRTKFAEQGIKVLKEGVVTGEEMKSKGVHDQHYYVVEFDPATLSWADFRGKVLGPTNPADAPPDSLRGIVAANWQKLGLQAPCDDSDNAVHASASPFESLVERTNWLACCVSDDPFGRALLAKGVPEATIKKWFNDPHVKYDDETAKEMGKAKGSIFDALKDLDNKQCLDRCAAINKASAMTAKGDHVEDKVEEATPSPPQEIELTNPRSAAEAQAIVGRRVLVQGMQQRKDLNGRHAKVLEWNAETSRWDIEMETMGNETVLVRSSNLSIIGGAGTLKKFMKTRSVLVQSSDEQYM